MSLKREYVDSHWLIFAFQGVVSLLFGWFILFSKVENINVLITIVGVTLLGLGIIELFNLLRRTHLQETWGISLAMAFAEIAAAFLLLFTLDMNNVYHLVVIACFTVFRGLMQIILGIKSVDDRTDRFIWAILGMCGCIMGFVILNTDNFIESVNFIKTFGAYMTLAGLGNLIYGVHNRDQGKELAESYRTARKTTARRTAATATTRIAARNTAKKPAKTTKSTAKKTTAKSSTKTTTRKTASKSKTTRKSPAKKTTARSKSRK